MAAEAPVPCNYAGLEGRLGDVDRNLAKIRNEMKYVDCCKLDFYTITGIQNVLRKLNVAFAVH